MRTPITNKYQYKLFNKVNFVGIKKKYPKFKIFPNIGIDFHF